MAGLYIHIPFCKSRCIYCGFYSTTAFELRQQYTDALCREIADRASGSIGTIYLGGGTPSQLTLSQLHQIFDTIYKYNKVEKDAEVTIEVNPDDVTEELAAALPTLSVNRVSMGAQTFDDERLAFLHRRHTSRQVGEAIDRLRKAGISNIKGYICDVTDEGAVKALVEKIHAEVGNIDILVNNAGIIKRIPMHEMKRSEFQQVIDIDLVGPYICASAVLPEMMERREGKIINVCSMMSELGRETVSAYAAAKGGLKMLTRNICSEYGEYNIQCNGIGPGYIATPQTAPLREPQPDGSRHPFDSFICAKTPAGRWLDPEELGGPAVFLASHASDGVNGHILYVDGGILAYIGKQPK